MPDTNAPMDSYPQSLPHSFDFVLGPSFKEGLPAAHDWEQFASQIKGPASRKFADLWLAKAQAAKGVPNRKDFSFKELVKFGPELILFKRHDSGRWMTTFCGTKIVDILGFELTGRYMDDYGSATSLDFWLENMAYLTEESRIFLERYDLEFAGKAYLRCTSVNLPLLTGTSSSPDSLLEIMQLEPQQTGK